MAAITNTYDQASRWTQKQIASHPRLIPLLNHAYKVSGVAAMFSYLNYVLGTSWIPSCKDTGLFSVALATFFLGRQNDLVITPENILSNVEELKSTIFKAKQLPTLDSMYPRLEEFFTVLKTQGKQMHPNLRARAIQQLTLIQDVLDKTKPLSALLPQTPKPKNVITHDNILENAQALKSTIFKAKQLPTLDSMYPRLKEFFTVLKNHGKAMNPEIKAKAIQELTLIQDVLDGQMPVSALLPKPAAPKAMPIADLFARLEEETTTQLKGLKFFSVDKLPHRFPVNVFCPEATAIWADGRPMHANRVGEGITKRLFIASQAPLVQDYERFWQAAFVHSAAVIDLTTIEDQTKGGVTKYYPEKLGKTVKYGKMLVTLHQIKGNLFFYKVKDTEIGITREIKRFRYDSWKDFSAVNLPTLQMLVKQVKTLVPNSDDIVWIHCRAGLGRTGTLITALILEEKIQKGEITKENLDVELVKLIVSLRKQRGPGFVQSQEQLDLLRQFAFSLLG